jgi:hypothetical protein
MRMGCLIFFILGEFAFVCVGDGVSVCVLTGGIDICASSNRRRRLSRRYT